MNRNKIIVALFALGLYLISFGASYLFFANTVTTAMKSPLPSATVGANGTLAFDNNLPKTEECPLNGALYSKQQRSWWEKHRPLGVMIENHQEARPQSGLSGADVVYEAVAEGGITRFLAMFYCQDAGEVGPVRSARTYYIDYASEYADYPLYAHVGGANQPGPADAISQLSDYGWAGYNDLNQFSIGFPTFWRDYDRLGHSVATEHTMYSTVGKLWDYAAKERGLTNVDKDGNAWDKNFVPWKFVDDATISQRPKAQSIHLEFWTGDPSYYVDWKYDSKTNLYKRTNGGSSHLDRDTNKQIAAKDVVVLFLGQESADDGYENNVHLLFQTKGTGKAVLFKDGKRINGTWEKDKRTSRTIIKDSTGAEVKFDRGLIWFEILPTDGVLTVK
ncbi:MAG TPA: DUF3048 domain-containing protein [Candidatus Sulfotelmatobacter sp.]|nr:DUF3048 domain-containing protein [Candidatus Sulfotelmatobacter sp.]